LESEKFESGLCLRMGNRSRWTPPLLKGSRGMHRTQFVEKVGPPLHPIEARHGHAKLVRGDGKDWNRGIRCRHKSNRLMTSKPKHLRICHFLSPGKLNWYPSWYPRHKSAQPLLVGSLATYQAGSWRGVQRANKARGWCPLAFFRLTKPESAIRPDLEFWGLSSRDDREG
jgi:hypothetical protein